MAHLRTNASVGLAAVLFAASCGGPGKSAAPPAEPTPIAPGTPVTPATPATPETPAAPAVNYTPAPPPADAEMTTLAAVGLDGAVMDRKADPCVDFYQFACGGWLAKDNIPGDRPAWARSFDEIDKNNQENLHQILEAAAADKGKDPVIKKIGDFYAACMDEPGIETSGFKALAPLLATIDKVKDTKSLGAAVTEAHKYSIDVLWGIGSSQDAKNATHVITTVSQGGLGLPEKDYYFRDDEPTKAIRKAYVDHIAKMLELAGAKPEDAAKQATDVMALETDMAKVSYGVVEQIDPQKNYHKIDRVGLKKAFPGLDWDAYFKALGRPDLIDINVAQVSYFEGLAPLYAKTAPATWRAYLRYHTLSSYAGTAMPKAFRDEAFKFNQLFTGQPEDEVRWKKCVRTTDATLGELLAQPYVKRYFGGDAKTAADDMVSAILGAFGDNLKTLDWMDDATRGRAFTKLGKVVRKIGFPAKWQPYDWKVDRKNYLGDVLASYAYETTRDLKRIGKPVERDRWGITPPTVNAYYNPQLNEIVFPAGILQPPFFNPKASVAVNLGAIGGVIGHELTHGFDNRGAQYDADGNLKDWWEAATKTKFEAKTKCVVDQYASYEALPGLKLNGELTVGENIADIGGTKMAYRAYRKLRAGKKPLYADGFSEDQQFFLGWGQGWCEQQRPEYERALTQQNPHSPSRFRVNGVFSDTPEFAAAFQCKEGTPMHPKNACNVW